MSLKLTSAENPEGIISRRRNVVGLKETCVLSLISIGFNEDTFHDILPEELIEYIKYRKLPPKQLAIISVRKKDWNTFSTLRQYRFEGICEMVRTCEWEKVELEINQIENTLTKFGFPTRELISKLKWRLVLVCARAGHFSDFIQKNILINKNTNIACLAKAIIKGGNDDLFEFFWEKFVSKNEESLKTFFDKINSQIYSSIVHNAACFNRTKILSFVKSKIYKFIFEKLPTMSNNFEYVHDMACFLNFFLSSEFFGHLRNNCYDVARTLRGDDDRCGEEFLFSFPICDGIEDYNIDTLEYILDNRKLKLSNDICYYYPKPECLEFLNKYFDPLKNTKKYWKWKCLMSIYNGSEEDVHFCLEEYKKKQNKKREIISLLSDAVSSALRFNKKDLAIKLFSQMSEVGKSISWRYRQFDFIINDALKYGHHDFFVKIYSIPDDERFSLTLGDFVETGSMEVLLKVIETTDYSLCDFSRALSRAICCGHLDIADFILTSYITPTHIKN